MDRGNVSNIALFAFVISVATYLFCICNATPFQDFCVGINSPDSSVSLNGKFCKNTEEVTIDDFLYKGFNIPGNITNTQHAKATLVDVNRFPAVNALGVSIARVDFAPSGLNTPHLHPHGSEIFTVVEGSLYAGFVTTENKLFDTVLKKGDIIVFPQGLIHFQLNVGDTNAVAIAAFGNENPGRVNIANGVFGTTPSIFEDVLTKAFQVDKKVIKKLQGQFSSSVSESIPRLISQFDDDTICKS